MSGVSSFSTGSKSERSELVPGEIAMAYLLTMPTAFEWQLRRLGLDEQTCVKSKEMKEWCECNKDRHYIPEWLLERWGMSVDTGRDEAKSPGPLNRLETYPARPPSGKWGWSCTTHKGAE